MYSNVLAMGRGSESNCEESRQGQRYRSRANDDDVPYDDVGYLDHTVPSSPATSSTSSSPSIAMTTISTEHSPALDPYRRHPTPPSRARVTLDSTATTAT